MKHILTILFVLTALFSFGQTISSLPAASTLGGTEVVPGVQSGTTKKISINQIHAFNWDLAPTLTTNDTIGFVLVRRTSDGKIFKRSVSSLVGAFWPLTGSANMTGNVTINTGANDLVIDGPNTAGAHDNSIRLDQASGLVSIDAYDNSAESYAAIYVRDTQGSAGGVVLIGGDDTDSNYTKLQISGQTQGGAYFEDNRTTKVGIEYLADYSADFTDRSLVDKEYVDDAVAGAGGGGATAAGSTGDVQVKSAGGGLQADTGFNYDTAANILSVPLVKITSGSPGANKVLTSDADGDASWVAGAIGAQDLIIPAAGFWPAVTNGCDPLAPTEVSSITYQSLDFDQTTQQFAMIQFVMPRNWNNGTITATPYWTAATSSGGVVWGISAVAISNDDPFSSSFGTAQTSTDTFITANDVHVGPTTSAITVGGTPADGDLIVLRVSRNPADGSDTLAADAKLLSIRITYTLDAAVSE